MTARDPAMVLSLACWKISSLVGASALTPELWRDADHALAALRQGAERQLAPHEAALITAYELARDASSKIAAPALKHLATAVALYAARRAELAVPGEDAGKPLWWQEL